MKILFFLSLGILLYVYFGYPLLLLILSKIKKPHNRSTAQLQSFPSVSLIIPAYNEEEIIEEKIKNSFSLDYPGKVEIILSSDGSTDKTVEITSKFKKVKINDFKERKGKMATLNRTLRGSYEGTKAPTGEIIIFTDANAMFEKDALKNLIRNFADKSIGCVCGAKRIKKENLPARRSALAGGCSHLVGGCEKTYWKMENFLKEKESEIGSCIADGSIYALRKELYPFPREDKIIMDDFAISLGIINKNYRVVFEPKAVAYESASLNTFAEFKRKVRILEGALATILSCPIKRVGFQIVSHKILRWLGGIFMITLLISNLFIACPTSGRRESISYQVFLMVQMCFYLFALVGFGATAITVAIPISSGRKHKIFSLFYSPFYFCLTNLAQVIGFLKYIVGSKQPFWERAERIR
ncbi:glycosyltransferase [candidate division WOR-3 bacterium]|nr:glycosyltransferase [candidate division WOR-3 bacterium]